MANENSIITKFRREQLAKITSGQITSIDKIAYIALGDGGATPEGTPIAPNEEQTALVNELKRYEVGAPEFPVPTTARYTITVPEADLAGQKISEVGLLDAQGKLCAVRNCSPKGKDADETFTFVFDDEF